MHLSSVMMHVEMKSLVHALPDATSYSPDGPPSGHFATPELRRYTDYNIHNAYTSNPTAEMSLSTSFVEPEKLAFQKPRFKSVRLFHVQRRRQPWATGVKPPQKCRFAPIVKHTGQESGK